MLAASQPRPSSSRTTTRCSRGEFDYEQQLKDYDAAFATFFTRLQKEGITKDNSLFVVTVDEGDHFVGGTGTPDPDPTHTGALVDTHAPCSNLSSCPSDQGEVTTNVKALFPTTTFGNYDIHFDDAPTFYLNGQPTGTDPNVRALEQAVAGTSIPDPFLHLADPYEDDGRVIVHVPDGPAVPDGLHGGKAEQLGDIHKQLNAPLGSFGQDTLVASTAALGSNSALKYDSIESQIAALTQQRNDLAGAPGSPSTRRPAGRRSSTTARRADGSTR